MPGAPGALPAAAPAGLDFSALLPGFTVPTLPRQRDGEGGNILPAVPGKDEEAGNDASAAIWIAPPTWLISCPPPASIGAGEDAPALPASGPVRSADVPLSPGQLTALPVHAPGAEQVTAYHTLADPGAAVIAVPGTAHPLFAATPLPTSPGSAVPDVLAAAVTSVESFAVPLQARNASTAETQDLALPPTVNPAAAPAGQPHAGEAIMSAPGQGRSPVSETDGAFVTPSNPGLSAPTVQQGSPAPLQKVPAEQVRLDQEPAASMPAPVLEDRVFVGSARSEPERIENASNGASRLASRPQLPAGATSQIFPSTQAGQVAPAAQMFAAAIHRAVRDDRAADQGELLIAPSAAPTADLAPHPVAAIEGGRHAALDMFRDTWPAKMIERIEMIRDAMDAVDTSIRLVPDKLGTIDVSLRRDGDRVAVQFHAQQAETRQLLADAQPKLAELAEARGLKLTAQAGQGDGQSQHSHQQQRAPSPAPLSPHRPGRIASDDDAALADERIA
ncbi:flagellar hook-length control protein FliK [Sphingomonas sp. IC-11]|uniref:flagellar hook-length control protein FliK n=1 Tax=Sphingomonas sp. IC-11 TaxID=2898528 RepID=UPI001E43C411|nr:flagellar hook-length control protein FliK [Sphingomonas sp. IC-11]MCD2314770.1 flagellar hook-length control protein FliK [Sphingomonas sp. IC-11]